MFNFHDYRLVAFAIFLFGQSFILMANFIYVAMLGEVNGSRSADQRKYSVFGTGPIKCITILNEHEKRFPESNLRKMCGALLVLGLIVNLIALTYFLMH
jgi:hypothetical protein